MTLVDAGLYAALFGCTVITIAAAVTSSYAALAVNASVGLIVASLILTWEVLTKPKAASQ